MKHFFISAVLFAAILAFSGCAKPERLPAEDIEVLQKHADVIAILRNPKISPNSREKYEAAKELVRLIDLHFVRETSTVNKLFYHKDASADGLNTETPVFSFTYQYRDNFIRIRFFTCRMFVTRVEILEK